MRSYDFWEEREERTPQEDAAIGSLEAARTRILTTIPREELIAIYAKGSLVRRELNERSDVDTLTIVKHSRWLRSLMKLHRTQRSHPPVCFSGYSLWELERNKRSKAGKPDRGSPARTIAHLKHYELIYGTPLDPDAFGHGTDERTQLASMIRVFRSEFLPAYAQKRFAFTDLVKQTFWLAEGELRVQGIEPAYHWGRLTQRFPKNHLIHDALELRTHPTKDRTRRAAYVRKLEAYLSSLEKSLRTHRAPTHDRAYDNQERGSSRPRCIR